jgi:hypothetical protein
MRITGVVESSRSARDKWLHIAVETPFKSRTIVLSCCASIASRFIKLGATDYSRYTFSVRHEKGIPSIVSISPDKLHDLIAKQADISHLAEAFIDPILLWHDESQFRHRLRMMRLIFVSHFHLSLDEARCSRHATGVWRGAGRYWIRETDETKIGFTRILRVHAVVRYPRDALDRGMTKEIVAEIIRKLSRKRRMHPRIVEVHLHATDGALRWLKSGGWLGGNLLAFAQKAFFGAKLPSRRIAPEEVWRGIELRYTMLPLNLSEQN